MTFLSIAFLAAIPLAAAPILLHLFDRRRNVVIEWGAMQFLMEAATRRTSARRLKQWLLLLLRVMAVAALVLALARPMLPGSWFGASERGETIFIIDNSMSMLRTSGNDTLFDQAIARAVAILDEIQAGDSVRVLLASPYPVWASGGSVRVDSASRRIIAERLGELKATHGRSDLLAALLTAAQAEVEPTQQRRRIVLLSDGQGSDWNLADEADWKRFAEILPAAPVPTELEVYELGRQTATSNLAVDAVQANRTVAGVQQPFTLTGRIHNHGPRPTPACQASWRIGDEEHYTAHIPALESGQSHDVVWKHSLARPGVYTITCQIDANDELAPDNQAAVVIEVVNEIPVVVLEGAADRAELQQDAFFVQAALGWMHGEPLGQPEVHVPLVVDPERLERLDLRHYRAVVIPNLTSLDAELVDRLTEFVAGGGGLWIGLGPRTDVDAFNQRLFADGNGLAPLAIDRIVDEQPDESASDRSPKTRIDPLASKHPAVVALSNAQQLDTAEVGIWRRFRFIAPLQGQPASVLLSLNSGQPLAVEKLVGRGRVIVQAIPLRLEWSELARSQAFVVMVQEWLTYLTQPRATRHNLSPGEPIAVQLADTQSREATLRTPHGDEFELTADTADDGMLFRTSRTILPGAYWLETGLSDQAIPFHVHRDPAESDLATLPPQDRDRLAELAGLSRAANEKSVGGVALRQPLWPALLLTLCGLMAAELILSGVIARERFGTQPISQSTPPWLQPWQDLPVTRGSPIAATAAEAAAGEMVQPTEAEVFG